MNIKQLGGEFALIDRIARPARRPEVLVGIGDDAAVVRHEGGNLVLTTDMICEGDHFSRDYFKPEQIGIKAMMSNLSDIAAMGARPLYALVSLALTRDVDVETVEVFYRGLHRAADPYQVDIIGGDITHTGTMVVCLTVIGESPTEAIRGRDGARPGDVIKVTGTLGGSTAGLKLFLKDVPGHEPVKLKHTEPVCRLDISDRVAGLANAMEDVSDGLASEVRNICLRSGVGAVIDYGKIPIDPAVEAAARVLGDDARDYALYGGEDFELTYTVTPDRAAAAPGFEVGIIVEGEGVVLKKGEEKIKLTRFGYDHFA